MQYTAVVAGRFLSRPNRFIAHVELGGREVVAHVKNTGRCRELLLSGARIWLQEADDPARKTKYDLIAVEKGKRIINMDSQAPNRVFGEWAAAGHFCPDFTALCPEVVYGESRFDFRLETPEGLHFVEVKGVTLEEDGVARFPDAPTERGVKHVQELQAAVAAGHRATIFFVIQMEDIDRFEPNDRTHPAFGAALREAQAAGVDIQAWSCRVTPDSLAIDRSVPVVL